MPEEGLHQGEGMEEERVVEQQQAQRRQVVWDMLLFVIYWEMVETEVL